MRGTERERIFVSCGHRLMTLSRKIEFMLTRCYWETVFGGNIGDKKHAAYNEFFHAMNFQNNVVVVVMSSAFNPLQSDFKSG